MDILGMFHRPIGRWGRHRMRRHARWSTRRRIRMPRGRAPTTMIIVLR
jgi:hypothetical protein